MYSPLMLEAVCSVCLFSSLCFALTRKDMYLRRVYSQRPRAASSPMTKSRRCSSADAISTSLDYSFSPVHRLAWNRGEGCNKSFVVKSCKPADGSKLWFEFPNSPLANMAWAGIVEMLERLHFLRTRRRARLPVLHHYCRQDKTLAKMTKGSSC